MGGNRYVTSELLDLERRLSEAHEQALQRETLLLEALMAEVLTHESALRQSAETIARLDVSSALADVAVTENYSRPVVSSDEAFRLVQGRHPVVERYVQAQRVSFVPNDCVLEGSQRAWLLTGPNMAGKSTFLRQNALVTVLAQMGSFVPATQAYLGVVDRIFSRIGAHDDLSKGHSTFMTEMIEAALILNRATKRSLVVVDELGRGTTPSEGIALAYACLEHWVQTTQCRLLFATHYHELAQAPLEGLAPYTMELRVDPPTTNIVFLHRVVPGIATQAFAWYVAKAAGLPQTVLERARHGYPQTSHTGFGSFPLDHEPLAPVVDHPLVTQMRALDPDTLSPKDALEALYRFKRLVD